VLKKAGIVVAAAAAGLLAVSPLAFAGDKGDDHGSRHASEANVIADSSEGLVNVAGNNFAVPVNVCDNQVPVNVLGVQVPLNDDHLLADLTGALGLGILGNSDAKASHDGDATLDDSCSADAVGEANNIND
jgi:hypothetical protein